MSDIARVARKIERILGAPVEIVKSAEGTPLAAEINDPETQCKFTRFLGPPSKRVENLKALHEQVYRQRGRMKFTLQGGRCAICGRPMKGDENTEIDHIESRGAHGRSDVMTNLRVVHGDPCHRERHSKTQRRTA